MGNRDGGVGVYDCERADEGVVGCCSPDNI